MLASLATSAALIGGFLAANVDYAPAHRGFVRAQVKEIVGETISQTVDAKFRTLEERQLRSETRQSTTQLQVNTLRRDTLEKEKFDLNIKLREAANNDTRALIEQRLRQINDDLNDVQQERARIRSAP